MVEFYHMAAMMAARAKRLRAEGVAKAIDEGREMR